MQTSKLAWLSGLTGLGLIVIGSVMYARERKLLAGAAGAVGGASQLGLGRGRAAQAPVVNSYSDGNMRTTLRASGDMPIEQRLATIQDLVEKSIQDPEMRKLALKVTAHCPERDGECEAKAVYDFVKANVRYTGDIAPIRWSNGTVEGVDLYQTARRTIELGGGDCDDQAIVNATLLALNGITPRLRVVKTRGAPDWEHIYAGALLPKGSGNKFVALDTTLPGTDKFGIEPPYHKHVDFDA